MAADLAHLRHKLHQFPEIGLDLPRTQEVVLAELDGLGFEITLGTELSSVAAVLRGGKRDDANPTTVLLRADMDALPVQESTNMPYASLIDGAMHACGHDLHITMLLGAAKVLSARQADLAGDVVLMFQPGEEGLDGASVMVREGILNVSGHLPDASFGMHVMSGLETGGTVFSKPGTAMGAADTLHVTVLGSGGHGSAPHLAKDPISVAAEMISSIHAMITVGTIQAGSSATVIPETAMFKATVRSFSPKTQARLRTALATLLESIAIGHGMTADVVYEDQYPMLINDVTEHEFAQRTAIELFGDDRYRAAAHPLAASEDFSRILNAVPGAFLFLSAAPEGADLDAAAFNHSPYAVFADDVLTDGAALYARLAIDRLNR
nr:M20 family metallopeptidase [Leucobacter exalbidus]